MSRQGKSEIWRRVGKGEEDKKGEQGGYGKGRKNRNGHQEDIKKNNRINNRKV